MIIPFVLIVVGCVRAVCSEAARKPYLEWMLVDFNAFGGDLK